MAANAAENRRPRTGVVNISIQDFRLTKIPSEEVILESFCFIASPDVPFKIAGLTGEKKAKREESAACVLRAAIKTALALGQETFYYNGGCGFNLMAVEQLVLRWYIIASDMPPPETRLISVLPYEHNAEDWDEPLRQRYFYVLESSNEVLQLHAHFQKGCREEVNRWIIDRSGLVFTAHGDTSPETREAISYARSLGRTLVSLSFTDM